MLLLLPTLIIFFLLRNIYKHIYIKGILAKVNFGELAENQLKKVQTAKLERASRCKPKNKVV